jgi:hypothetical protein
LLEKYESGEYDETINAIRQLVDPAIAIPTAGPGGRFRGLANEVNEVVSTWIESPKKHSLRDRRARVASSMTLEAARLGLNFRVRLETCLDWLNVGLRVRRANPSPGFDKYWYLATLSVIEGTGRPDLVEQFVATTTETTLDEPYRVLALAVAKELRRPDERLALHDSAVPNVQGDAKLMTRDAPTRLPRPAPYSSSIGNQSEAHDLREAKDAFDRARRFGPVQAEATLRLGRVLARLREENAALVRLREVPQLTHDPELISLSHLFRGEIHDRAMRTDEAVAAYRAAIAASPRARMAHSMLAPLLFRTGARNEAADLC